VTIFTARLLKLSPTPSSYRGFTVFRSMAFFGTTGGGAPPYGVQWVHRTRAAKLRRRQIAMGAQNFEALHWSAENQGWCQRVAKYTTAYGSHGRARELNGTEVHSFSVTYTQRERRIHRSYPLFAVQSAEVAVNSKLKKRQETRRKGNS
jgi:hypothetical protein